MKNLEEAKLISRLFTNMDSVTNLQKTDKILLDNLIDKSRRSTASSGTPAQE